MFFLIFTEGQRSSVIANIKQLLSFSIGIQILVHFQGTSFFLFFFPSNPLWSPNIFISYFDKTVGTISIPLIISPKMLNSCGLFIF